MLDAISVIASLFIGLQLDRGFGGIEEDCDVKMELRAKYIKKIFERYMVSHSLP